MIKAILVGDDKLKSWIASRYPAIQDRLGKSMARIVIALSRKIKEEKLTGQVLKNRTGTLRRSISHDVDIRPPAVVGSVGTNVVYAHIHEFGGRTSPHVIMPKKGRALAFQWHGEQKFFKKVNHPGSVFPERSFMRSALREMEPEIREEFKKALLEVIGGRY
jgi:phage gpG-like protein